MAKDLTFTEIKRNILQKNFAPVYLFQGEEPYFIDKLTDLLVENVLDESERDFNQTIVYGSDTSAATVINASKRYPMMAERQLVVVKEAQSMKDIQELVHYVKQPLASTVLVINHKYGKLDGRKPLAKAIATAGVAFESKKYYDNQIPSFILSYLQDKQVDIEPKAAQMMTDHLGVDLSKLTNELDKLCILLSGESRRITAAIIEENIGISKDFNNFELQRAVAAKDMLKAQQIAIYFDKNQKNNPYNFTLSLLFNFFSNLIICQFEKDRSMGNIMNILGLRHEIQVRDYMTALGNYKPKKTMENIALIRNYDAKGKGFGNSGTPPGRLLVELLFRLMH